MPPPFLFLGATLIFWGWQIDLLLPALVMALVLEASRQVKAKWDLSLSDFNRVADVCTILLAGLVVFVVATTSLTSIITILRWLPVIFFPLLAAQEYSVAGEIDIRSLMLTARKKVKGVKKSSKTVQLSYPYAVLCILAAGTANLKDGSFYICLVLLTAWALLSYRCKRFSPVWWLVLVTTAGGAGYVGHIGEMKLSDRIVFRISPESEPFNPVLLRESSYNTYRGSTWYSTPARFTDISPEADRTTWKLGGESGRRRGVHGLVSPEKRRGHAETAVGYLSGGKSTGGSPEADPSGGGQGGGRIGVDQLQLQGQVQEKYVP